jgi:hypothetical protein
MMTLNGYGLVRADASRRRSAFAIVGPPSRNSGATLNREVTASSNSLTAERISIAWPQLAHETSQAIWPRVLALST